jgi:hypothetical protein
VNGQLDTKKCVIYLRKKLTKYGIKVGGGGTRPIDIAPPTGCTGYVLWIQGKNDWFLDQVSMVLLRDVSPEELEKMHDEYEDAPHFSKEINEAVKRWMDNR